MSDFAQSRKLRLVHVIEAVERLGGLEQGAILSEARQKPLIRARRTVALIGWCWLGLSQPKIGAVLRLNHTTVLHHLRVARAELAADGSQAEELRRVIDVAMALAGAGRLTPEVWAARRDRLCAVLPPSTPPSPASGSPPDEPVVQPAAAAEREAIWQGREWWAQNDAAFVAEMRRLHPEREVALPRPPARASASGATEARCDGQGGRTPMSDVTADEIATLCAQALGTTLEEMRRKHRPKGKRPVKPAGLVARQAAIWLALRHTEATTGDLARLLGLSDARDARRAFAAIDRQLEQDSGLQDVIERIETEIDRLHESRVAGAERRAA